MYMIETKPIPLLCQHINFGQQHMLVIFNVENVR